MTPFQTSPSAGKLRKLFVKFNENSIELCGGQVEFTVLENVSIYFEAYRHVLRRRLPVAL